MKANVEPLTVAAFQEEYDSKELLQGKNLLTLKVALKFIGNFLDAEL